MVARINLRFIVLKGVRVQVPAQVKKGEEREGKASLGRLE